MATIKAFLFACIALLLLTGSNCSFRSVFGDDDDDDEKDDGLIIVISNAETTSGEVVGSLTQTLMAAEIASQSAEFMGEIITLNPIRYTCDNSSGNILVTVNDLDFSNTISVRDDLLLDYSNCNIDNLTANGNLAISLLDAKGIDIGNFDSGASWLYSISTETNSLVVSRGNETFIVDGEMSITVEFDATAAKLENKITSERLSLVNDATNIPSDIDISQFINLAAVPSSYTLTIDSLNLSSGTQNGTVSANTLSDTLSGMELLSLSEHFADLKSPENGMVSISGKNSNAEVSIMPDQSVSIDLDTDGDSISDTVVTSTWSQLQSHQ
jgi:hypothetical protein